jgi:hypothetical protein
MPGMTGYELLKKIKVSILFFSSSCCSCSNSLIKGTSNHFGPRFDCGENKWKFKLFYLLLLFFFCI